MCTCIQETGYIGKLFEAWVREQSSAQHIPREDWCWHLSTTKLPERQHISKFTGIMGLLKCEYHNSHIKRHLNNRTQCDVFWTRRFEGTFLQAKNIFKFSYLGIYNWKKTLIDDIEHSNWTTSKKEKLQKNSCTSTKTQYMKRVREILPTFKVQVILII